MALVNAVSRITTEMVLARGRFDNDLQLTRASVHAAMSGIASSTRQTNTQLGIMNTRMASLERTAASAQRAIGAAWATLGGVTLGAFTQSVVDAGRKYDNMIASIRVGTDSQKEAEAAFIRQAERANVLGVNLEAVATNYARMVAASKGTSVEGKAVDDVFGALVETSAVLSLNSDQLGGILNAVTQIMSKGKVQAEELRGQLGERLAGAFNIAARAMGVTTAEMDKMLEQGLVPAGKFIPLFAAELRKQFGAALPEAMQRSGAAIERFNNQLFLLKILFAKSGFLDGLVAGMDRLGDIMKTPEFQNIATTFGKGIGDALAYAAEHADKLGTILLGIAGMKLGSGLVSLISLLAGVNSGSLAGMAAGAARGAAVGRFGGTAAMFAGAGLGLAAGAGLFDDGLSTPYPPNASPQAAAVAARGTDALVEASRRYAGILAIVTDLEQKQQAAMDSAAVEKNKAVEARIDLANKLTSSALERAETVLNIQKYEEYERQLQERMVAARRNSRAGSTFIGPQESMSGLQEEMRRSQEMRAFLEASLSDERAAARASEEQHLSLEEQITAELQRQSAIVDKANARLAEGKKPLEEQLAVINAMRASMEDMEGKQLAIDREARMEAARKAALPPELSSRQKEYATSIVETFDATVKLRQAVEEGSRSEKEYADAKAVTEAIRKAEIVGNDRLAEALGTLVRRTQEEKEAIDRAREARALHLEYREREAQKILEVGRQIEVEQRAAIAIRQRAEALRSGLDVYEAQARFIEDETALREALAAAMTTEDTVLGQLIANRIRQNRVMDDEVNRLQELAEARRAAQETSDRNFASFESMATDALEAERRVAALQEAIKQKSRAPLDRYEADERARRRTAQFAKEAFFPDAQRRSQEIADREAEMKALEDQLQKVMSADKKSTTSADSHAQKVREWTESELARQRSLLAQIDIVDRGATAAEALARYTIQSGQVIDKTTGQAAKIAATAENQKAIAEGTLDAVKARLSLDVEGSGVVGQRIDRLATENSILEGQLDLVEKRVTKEKALEDAIKRRQERLAEQIGRRTRTPEAEFGADMKALNDLIDKRRAEGNPMSGDDIAYAIKTLQDELRQGQRGDLGNRRDWMAGAQRALIDYADEATNAARNTEQIFTSSFDRMEDTLIGFTTTGRFEWEKMLTDMAAMTERILLRQFIFGPLAEWAQTFFPSGAMSAATASSIQASAAANVASMNIFHRGTAEVGRGGSDRRMASPALWARAPRLHGGLKSDEFPAILQKGEAVIPKGGSMASESGPSIYQTFNIDARGASDPDLPAKVRQEARRAAAEVMAQQNRRAQARRVIS